MDIMYILQTIDKTILEQHIGNQRLQDFQGIILLKNQSKLLEQFLYVGRYPDGLRLLENCPPRLSVTMFLSAEDANDIHLPDCGNHNIIVSTLDIFDLYNRINIIIQNYLHWTNTLREALCSGQSLTQLLDTASDMIESPIYLLNSGYRLILGSSRQYFQEALGSELRKHGVLSYEQLQKLPVILPTSNAENSISVLHTSNPASPVIIDGICYHLCQIQKDSHHLATLLLAQNPEKQGIDFYHLLIDFSEIAAHTLLESLEQLLNQDAIFSALLQDLLNENLTESDDIQKRLNSLRYPVKAFCSFILIQTNQSKEQAPLSEVLLQQLQEIFPQTNMTVFRDHVVILFSQEERPVERLDFDYDKLTQTLEQFHAYAGISNASRHRKRLRTLYTIASSTIRLGKALHRFSENERLFSYEDYSMYYIIDLCAQKYIEEHHNNDLIYLIHPSIIKIRRYDAEHKSNLRDVLFYYLLSGCNLNKTAQLMYMHRNTILNKLNKISELTEIPLEDGYTRHRMIMSCLIMRYYEEYLKETVRL